MIFSNISSSPSIFEIKFDNFLYLNSEKTITPVESVAAITKGKTGPDNNKKIQITPLAMPAKPNFRVPACSSSTFFFYFSKGNN